MSENAPFIKFILDHAEDDTSRLLFASDRYPEIDVRKACSTIEARRKAKSKLPSWYAVPEIIYPGSLPLEQCSSEVTAGYKRIFLNEGGKVADITGGLGVDSSFFAGKAAEVTYMERSRELCEAARHNFELLGISNVEVVNTETSADNLPQGHFDLIYADPARRGRNSSRIYSISDCEPDILSLKDSLLGKADSLLVKISPMADIHRTLEQFPQATELHIVSLDGEVKELLVWCRKGDCRGLDAEIVCADLHSGRRSTLFRFTLQEEASSVPQFAGRIGKYLFVPGRSLLKAGAFRLCSSRFALEKLAPSTHLYTADSVCESFPGRIYRSVEAVKWSKSASEDIAKRYPSAELTAINFPLSTDALRRKMKIRDGGNVHIFATTVNTDKFLLICTRIQNGINI